MFESMMGGRRTYRPLRELFWVLIAMVLIAYLAVGMRLWHENLRETRYTLGHIDSMLVQAARTTLKSHELVLRGLGGELVSLGAIEDPDKGKELIDRMKSADSGMVGFGLARPDGQLVLVSGVPLGHPLPNLVKAPGSHKGFQKVLSAGHLRVGRPYPFPLLHSWVVPIRVPLRDSQGKLRAVMAAGYNIRGGTTAWARLALPPHLAIALVRDDGYPMYRQPLFPGGGDRLSRTYLHPMQAQTLKRWRGFGEGQHFLKMQVPALGGEQYVSVTPIQEYGLYAIAATASAQVTLAWLESMVGPTILLLVFMLAGILAYWNALRQQRLANAEVARLTAGQQAMLDDLCDEEERYRTLFESSGDALFLLRGPVIADCNPTACEMFGRERRQLIGVRLQDRSAQRQPDGQTATGLFEQADPSMLHDTSRLFEWRFQREGEEEFDAEVTLSSLKLQGQTHMLCAVRDISQRRRHEAQLVESREALLHVNQRLQLLNGLLQRLRGSLTQEQILNETMQVIIELAGSYCVAIYLYDTHRGLLTLVHQHGFDAAAVEYGRELPLDGSLSGLALQEGKVLISSDLRADERFEPNLRKHLPEVGLCSGAIAPLLSGEHLPIGTLNLFTDQVGGFDPEMVDTLVSIAHSVALAIDSARHLESLAYQASHDSLTGLPNRAHFHQRFGELVMAGLDGVSAVMLLDLDHFKVINDTLGHAIGDRVLFQASERLRESVESDSVLVCRLGGDEFALLVSGCEDRQQVEHMAHRLNEVLRRPFGVDGFEARLGASIGLALYPEHGRDSHALLRAADVAMYQAKQSSLPAVFYDREFDQQSRERLALANELLQAVQDAQLLLHYQPKIDVAGGQTMGFEALVRWQHPRLGLLYPSSFIDLVEMSEVVRPFSEAVVRLAVADKKRLHGLGYTQPVSINLSMRNLLDSACLAVFDRAIDEFDLPASELTVELTETVLMQDPELAVTLLGRFKQRGIKAAIDDFGTGYSSLAYLRRLPIAALKIDRSFIVGMLDNPQDQVIVRSIIALVHNLGLEVIAEGVENDQILELLRSMHCDQAQGYGVCRPLPLDELVSQWLRAEVPGDSQMEPS